MLSADNNEKNMCIKIKVCKLVKKNVSLSINKSNYNNEEKDFKQLNNF